MELQPGWEEAHSAWPVLDRGKPMELELAPLGPPFASTAQAPTTLPREGCHCHCSLCTPAGAVLSSKEPILRYSP